MTTRREFLQGSVAGISLSQLQWPALLAVGQAACTARDAQAQFDNLDRVLAADLAAVAAQIIPSSGDGPGADEAGVIYFFDKALGGFMAGAKPAVGQGVGELNAAVGQTHAGKRFAELTFDEQTAMLSQHDQTPFFGMVRFLTLAGMFAMPVHGGNRDRLGWQLLGFDPTHGWQPPFGYYDRDEHGGD